MWQDHPLAQSVRNPEVGSLIGLHKKRTIFPAIVTRSFFGGTIAVTYTDPKGKVCSHLAPPSELKVIDYPEINIGEEYWSVYSNKYAKVASVHYNIQLGLWYCRIPYEDGLGDKSISLVSIPMKNLVSKLRRNHENKQEIKKMALYIAVKNISDLPSLYKTFKDVSSLEHNVIIDDSYNSLQNRIRGEIQQHPENTWTIFPGTTIAETDRPPIRFRGL